MSKYKICKSEITYTEEYVKTLLQEISQLTNNWNALEEFILNHYIVGHTIQNASLDAILNKMKEIKDGNNEQSTFRND